MSFPAPRIFALLTACTALVAQTPGSSNVDPSILKVTLLGSGGGPRVDTQRYGISILVEAAGQKLLFDCGRGATLRAAEAGIRTSDLDKIFLTHLHSDHIISIPDLLLTAWSGPDGRKTPFQVWGARQALVA